MGEWKEYSFRELNEVWDKETEIILESRWEHQLDEGEYSSIHLGERGTLVEIIDKDAPDYQSFWGITVTIKWERGGEVTYEEGSTYDSSIGERYTFFDGDGHPLDPMEDHIPDSLEEMFFLEKICLILEQEIHNKNFSHL